MSKIFVKSAEASMEAVRLRRHSSINLIFCVFFLVLMRLALTDTPTKLRLCMVAGRDTGVQVTRLCSELEGADGSGASCSLAPDRLTCLRRVAKGRADFAAFQVEDMMVAARRNSDDIAVTNQLRTLAKPPFEYEVAAVIRNSINVSTLAGLRNSTFCHPGFGYETDWTGVVARFLEVRVVPQRCDKQMTLAENSLNSSAEFFRAACKAGPWVPDPDLDSELKSRYPTLCQLCDSPNDCSTLDKYWGRLGPLFCLTDGAGDVLWARLDHIKTHFTPEDPNLTPQGSVSDYSFLCPDGSLQSVEILLDKSKKPCVWISRPWPVVIANRKIASEVQVLVKTLALADSGSWQRALSLLVAPLQQHLPSTPTITTAEQMLNAAPGWLSAATFSPCGSAGSPKVCVNSNIKGSKCQWLSEAARAHGVRGFPLCHRAKDCLSAVASGEADMAVTSADHLYSAHNDHNLKVLLYERPDLADDLYLVTAVVTDNHHWTLGDLRGKRACFPSYNGASWKLVVAALRSKGMVRDRCGDERTLLDFFLSVCVTRHNGTVPLCPDMAYLFDEDESDDEAALRCLASGYGDVAFVDKAALNVISSNKSWAKSLNIRNFHYVCFMNLKQGCHIGWAPHGMIVVRGNESGVQLRQWRTMLERLDELFGPNHRTPTPAMQMFGTFDGQSNVIFHNSTRELVDYDTLTQETTLYSLDLIQVLREEATRCPSSSQRLATSLTLLIFLTAALLYV